MKSYLSSQMSAVFFENNSEAFIKSASRDVRLVEGLQDQQLAYILTAEADRTVKLAAKRELKRRSNAFIENIPSMNKEAGLWDTMVRGVTGKSPEQRAAEEEKSSNEPGMWDKVKNAFTVTPTIGNGPSGAEQLDAYRKSQNTGQNYYTGSQAGTGEAQNVSTADSGGFQNRAEKDAYNAQQEEASKRSAEYWGRSSGRDATQINELPNGETANTPQRVAKPAPLTGGPVATYQPEEQRQSMNTQPAPAPAPVNTATYQPEEQRQSMNTQPAPAPAPAPAPTRGAKPPRLTDATGNQQSVDPRVEADIQLKDMQDKRRVLQKKVMANNQAQRALTSTPLNPNDATPTSEAREPNVYTPGFDSPANGAKPVYDPNRQQSVDESIEGKPVPQAPARPAPARPAPAKPAPQASSKPAAIAPQLAAAPQAGGSLLGGSKLQGPGADVSGGLNFGGNLDAQRDRILAEDSAARADAKRKYGVDVPAVNDPGYDSKLKAMGNGAVQDEKSLLAKYKTNPSDTAIASKKPAAIAPQKEEGLWDHYKRKFNEGTDAITKDIRGAKAGYKEKFTEGAKAIAKDVGIGNAGAKTGNVGSGASAPKPAAPATKPAAPTANKAQSRSDYMKSKNKLSDATNKSIGRSTGVAARGNKPSAATNKQVAKSGIMSGGSNTPTGTGLSPDLQKTLSKVKAPTATASTGSQLASKKTPVRNKNQSKMEATMNRISKA